MTHNRIALAFTLLMLPCSYVFAASTAYLQTNLVSDLSTEGAVTVDTHTKNPWGMSFSTGSPFWISNQGTNSTTLYTGTGAPVSAIDVTIPGGPTGQVFNSAGGNNFPVAPGGTGSAFIFDTLSGTINAWNGSLGLMGTAATVKTTAGASYTGLAITPGGSSSPTLYAANFTNGGGINVFDSNFNQLNGTTFAGKFADPSVPAGYAPFNIQLVGNSLYVEYAQVGPTGRANRGAGLGFVDQYDLSGNLLQHFSGSEFNAPWGVALAPGNFGQFSNDLLVGNFGNGEINALDASGNFLGTLTDGNGNPIVNENLWALDFRTNGGSSSVPNGLYFDAGINGENDGLFGYLAPAPEPSVYGLATLGLTLVGGFAVARKRQVRS
ncbi:MAG: TIGR03118 family protein [Acidobacteriaceae bacterium]|nr:TIGR03118 family protein [Acidobacteriaceae bacterium]